MRFVSVTRAVLMLALLAIVSGFDSSAQSTERRGEGYPLVEGRRYVVAFPQVWASPTEKPMARPMQLFITSKSKANVRIRSTAANMSVPRISRDITVSPNVTYLFDVSLALMNEVSEMRNGFGIEVTGDRPISVMTYQAWMGNGELARHLPVEAWGKNYYSMNFYQDRYGTSGSGYKYRPSQILLIADKNNTVVTYTPMVDTEGGMDAQSTRAGSSQTITLEKGETFLIKSKINEVNNKIISNSSDNSDLSGTLIRASKPIGVVSGHTKVAIMRYPDVLPPTGAFAAEAHFVRNNVHDAMLPHEMAGKEFVTVPTMYTPTRVTGQGAAEFGIDDDRGDVIRVVALEDNTVISKMNPDGSFSNQWTLRAGESRIATAVETTTVWRSTKPALLGQYGKSYAKILPPEAEKGDGTQGHPTVESGMPMLQYVPSVDRWAAYGAFYSPEGMDNFFNIVFRTEEIGKIKVDGRTLTSAFGGSMRLLPGTPYAFIRTPIGAGDHKVESDDPSVKWSAWTYGSLDGLQQGRAYGTPVSIDLTVPCDDSLTVEEQIVCGDVDGVGRVITKDPTCGSIFAIYAEELNNYELIEDENFNAGDPSVKFKVLVKDKRQDAMARVIVITRSGKWVEKTYTYVADKVTYAPESINFGVIGYGSPSCQNVVLTNNTDKQVTIERIYVKAFPGVFKFNPAGNIVLQPRGTANVEVCATIQDAREKIDTMQLELECFDIAATELRVRGEEPRIVVGDYDWQVVPASSSPIERRIIISNEGKVDVVIRGYDVNALTPNFKIVSGLDLDGPEIRIAPGEKHQFVASYSPLGVADVQHEISIPFYTNARIIDTVCVLRGMGNTSTIVTNGYEWNERVIDAIVRPTTTQYLGKVEFENTQTLAATFGTPRIVNSNAPDGVFILVPTPGDATFPTQLTNAQGKQRITVAFVPNELANRAAERNDYSAQVEFPVTVDGKETMYYANLTAIAWQPQAKVNDLTCDNGAWTSTTSGGRTTYTGKITVVNEHPTTTNPTTNTHVGTAPLRVSAINLVGGPNPNVTIQQPAAGGDLIAPGDAAMEYTVTITATTPMTFQYEVVADAAYTAQGNLAVCPANEGTWSVAGGYSEVFVNDNTSGVINVKVTNNMGEDKQYSVSIAGRDAMRFLLGTSSVNVASGQTVTVPVTFLAGDKVTKIDFAAGQDPANIAPAYAANFGVVAGLTPAQPALPYEAQVVFTDVANETLVQAADISGNAIYVETGAYIGEAYTVNANGDVVPSSNYALNVGQGKTVVAVRAAGAPQSLDVNTRMYGMRLNILYDNTLLGAFLNDAVTTRPGMTIEARQRIGTNQIQIDLKSETPIVQSNEPLVLIPFEAYLGAGSDAFTIERTNAMIKSRLVLRSAYSNTPVEWLGQRDADHVAIIPVDGQINVNLDCAKGLRLVGISNRNFAVMQAAPNPVSSTTVINYSIGLDGDTKIVLYNSMGERVLDLVNEHQSVGQYELTLDLSQLPAGSYYYQVVSGPFTSQPQSLHIVR